MDQGVEKKMITRGGEESTPHRMKGKEAGGKNRNKQETSTE